MASPETKYIDAAFIVRGLHENFDAGLIRSKAESHNPPILVSEGFFFEPMIHGAYNVRIPKAEGWEPKLIKGTHRLVDTCIEYRVSGYIGGMHEGDTLLFGTAGGPVQPKKEIFDAHHNLMDAIFALNPSLLVDMYYHVALCGGANYHTDGHFAKLVADGKTKQEDLEMQNYAMKYRDSVQKLNKSATVTLYRAEITNHYKPFAGRTKIK